MLNISKILSSNSAITAAKQNYQRWLFIKYSLLTEASRYDENTNILRERLMPLKNLKGIDLIRHGTPFFWMNVDRFHRHRVAGTRNVDSIIRHLLMAGFDSFFELLPDGATFMLDAVSDSDIVMPKLGIRIPLSSCKAVLRRVSPNSFEVKLPEKYFLVNLDNPEPSIQIPRVKIPGYDKMQLLLLNAFSLFGRDYVDIISPESVNGIQLANIISKSLDLIKTVNPDLYSQISALISWFVPLIFSQEIYHSFTTPDLVGIIFLSSGYDELYIAEVIIHEFHHAELYTIMETQQLFKEEPDQLFYSPWRDDPRPLEGLLHALYVFSGIADFYAMIEKFPGFEHMEKVHERRLKIYHQMRLGLAQVQEDHLTSIGHNIILSIREFLNTQGELVEAGNDFPPQLKSHLKNWCENNPDIAHNVKVPQ